MNKFFLLIALVLLLGACQKDSLKINESPDVASLLLDNQLTSLMLSVSAHDGSFDDVVDQSDCFSINFPYQILLNGESHNVNTINDLLVIHEQDSVAPIFPVDITFANYVPGAINNNNDLQSLIDQCAGGYLYNDRITCVDFVYPISIALYDTNNSDFETIIFDHDIETFVTLDNFNEDSIASINFPIEILIGEGTVQSIQDLESLKSELIINAIQCK